MKLLKYFILLLLISACSSINVNYDYDKDAKFASYKTYNYYANLETGLSELDTERLLVVVDSAMTTKGYSLSSTPDFFVDIQSSSYQNANSSSVGIGVGGTGGNVGGGISVGVPLGQGKYSRVIQFDFVDENGVGLFWQAISTYKFNPDALPEEREASFKAVVDKVFSSYPPDRE